MNSREQDIDDLTSMIGKRFLERCTGCDRYILKEERESCPHCNERTIDIGMGRIIELYESAILADARRQVGIELKELGEGFVGVNGGEVVSMMLFDLGTRLIERLSLEDTGLGHVIEVEVRPKAGQSKAEDGQ